MPRNMHAGAIHYLLSSYVCIYEEQLYPQNIAQNMPELAYKNIYCIIYHVSQCLSSKTIIVINNIIP